MLPLRIPDQQHQLGSSERTGPGHCAEAISDQRGPCDLKPREPQTLAGHDRLHRVLGELSCWSALTVVGSARHGLRAVCHALGLCASLVLATACGPRTGWQRIDQVCQSKDEPRVCFDAEPDAPLTLEVGGETLVPGECAEAPKSRSTVLRYAIVDGRTGERQGERVGVGRGRSLHIVVRMTDDGLEAETRRDRCR